MISFFTSPNRWMTLGRLLVVDVHDHRQRQHRLVGVLGHQVDRPQALVVAVRLGLPVIQCSTKFVVGTRTMLPA